MKKLPLLTVSGLFLSALTTGPAFAQARLGNEPGPCDRDCLTAMVDSYLTALVAHDPAAVPFASNVRYVENAEPMSPGQGLWETASAVPTTFKIYVPDPVARQVGFIGVMESSGKPVQLGLRLELDDAGKIVEAEHLVVYNVRENNLANLRSPRPGLLATVPTAERLPRELMLVIGMTYYDSIEQSSGDATVFADDCERHENGMITAGGDGVGLDGLPRQGCHDQMDSRVFTYIDSIDLRRVSIADEVTGLVFGLSQFRQSMKEKQITVIGRDGKRAVREVSFDPFDLPAAHIFKIRGGKIHEVEAVGFMMPYMSRNGWSDFLR